MPLNLALDPINYSALQRPIDLGAAVQQGFQGMLAQKAAEEQMRADMAAQAELERVRQAAIRNPSAATFNELFIRDPANYEAIKAAWDSKDADTQKMELADLSAVRGYVRAGRYDDATRLIQRRIDADKKAGLDTSDDEMMLNMIVDDPDEAGGVIDYQLAGIMGPDKWATTFQQIGDANRADMKLPGQMAETAANANKTIAETVKTVEEAAQIAPNAESERGLNDARRADLASQIETRAGQLDLDRDRLQTNTELELEKLYGKGTPLSGAAEAQMTAAVVSAESARQLAIRTRALADQMGEAAGYGGFSAMLNQGWSLTSGEPSPTQLLRQQYEGIVSSQAVKNLPPGPASDKDIEMAKKGFPDRNASPETLSSFLRGLAKLQDIQANREQARADWISENGNIGRAKRDITVNGVKVPAGSTFGDFSNSQAAVERRESVGERSYMRFGNGGR